MTRQHEQGYSGSQWIQVNQILFSGCNPPSYISDRTGARTGVDLHCWFSVFCQNVRLFFSFSYAAYKIQRTLKNRLLCIHLHAVKPLCHCCKWDKSPWCLPSIWADRFGAWVSVWVWLWTLVLGIKQNGWHCGDGLLFMARLWSYNKTFLYV